MILKIIVAAGFLLAGTAKLISAKPIVAQFEEFGLSNGIMRGIGILEVAGGNRPLYSTVIFLGNAGISSIDDWCNL